MTIQQIEDAIRGLSADELAIFRAWFAGFDAAAWDCQLERDVADGKLDSLVREGLDDLKEGRTTPL